MVVEDRRGAQREEVKGRDIRTSVSILKCLQPNSGPPTTVMKCSGSRNCDCTGFQPRKTSPKCRACSHPQGDHRESSSDDSSGDSDSSHEDSGRDTKEKTVSALVTNLLEDSNYTGVEVESARNEARAGLTRKRVGHSSDSGQLQELTALLLRVLRGNRKLVPNQPVTLNRWRLIVNELMGKWPRFWE